MKLVLRDNKKLLFGERNFSAAKNENFLLLNGILSPSTEFYQNGRFWGRDREVHTWWGQEARYKEGKHFW